MRTFPLILMMALTACDKSIPPSINGLEVTAPDQTTDEECPPTDESELGEEDELSEDELTNADSWGPSIVTFELEDGTLVKGDRISVLIADDVGPMDLTTTLRATDYNSSRSNKSLGMDLDTDGDSDVSVLRWGDKDCLALPCPSEARGEGGISRLNIDSEGRDYLAVDMAESSPRSDDYSGYVALGMEVDFRGHVTVLKAAATGDGTSVSSEADVLELIIYSGTEPVRVIRELDKSSTKLQVMEGGGAGAPNGMEMERSADGTLISLTW